MNFKENLLNPRKREKKVFGRQFCIQLLQQLTSTGFCVPCTSRYYWRTQTYYYFSKLKFYYCYISRKRQIYIISLCPKWYPFCTQLYVKLVLSAPKIQRIPNNTGLTGHKKYRYQTPKILKNTECHTRPTIFLTDNKKAILVRLDIITIQMKTLKLHFHRYNFYIGGFNSL